ncbi:MULTISPECIES: hypothetical protein [unclassified Herbaspirillum]|nr:MULTISPECIES: hypothetical protein [unclassified Herbaspirillum]
MKISTDQHRSAQISTAATAFAAGRRDGLQEMRSQAHGSTPTRYYGAEA